MSNSWRVPSFRVAELQRRVEVLNRRVTRTGGPGLTLEVSFESTVGLGLGLGLAERWSDVTVAGEVPRVDGWEFVARVEHLGEGGNIVSAAPGCRVELMSAWRHEGPTCDHCQASRVRKDTFVLRRGHEFKRVGRNCLADFLRSGDPEVALWVWSVYSSVRSLLNEAQERGYGPADPRGFETVYFLACTVAAIRESGWVGKGKAAETGLTPTAVIASLIAANKPKGRTPTAEDFGEAGEVVAWVEGLDMDSNNDYLSNLRSAVAVGCVERRHEGIVASGVAVRRRELEKASQAAADAAREAVRPSSHVGVVDKRYDLRGLTVRSVRQCSNDWGSSLMLLLEDQEGNDLKCFVRGETFEVGDVLGGKATIKSHEEYRGRKVTNLTRCKLEKGLPVQGVLPIPQVSSPPRSVPIFSDSEILF